MPGQAIDGRMAIRGQLAGQKRSADQMEGNDQPTSTPVPAETSPPTTQISPATTNPELEIKEVTDAIDWISPYDFRQEQDEIFSKYKEGSCDWFFNSAEYQKWLRVSGSILFCPGLPGVGKTVLTSAIVNRLSSYPNYPTGLQRIGIAYVFLHHYRCEHDGEDTVIASLLQQLIRGCFPLPEWLMKTTGSGRTYLCDTDNGIWEYMTSVCQHYDRVFILLDGVDEYDGRSGYGRKETGRLLSNLIDLSKELGVSIFATSRPDDATVLALRHWTSLEVPSNTEVVKRLLSTRLAILPAVIQQDESLQRHIHEKVSKASNGL